MQLEPKRERCGKMTNDERTIKILNKLKEDLDLALIKAKAQLEYLED